MRSSSPALLLLLALVAACGASSAPAAEPPRPTAAATEPADGEPVDGEPGRLAAELDPYLDSFRAAWGEIGVPHGVVHIVRGDRVLYSRGLGFADRAARTPNGVDTSFRIGSVTKQFTAAALLRLEARGLLSVEDTIGDHLPDYPEVGRGVTLHQLLTHTSGIPSYTSDPAVMARRDRPMALPDLIATFSSKPLEFEPGSSFRYSNSNYLLLGAILEKVAGAPLADVLRTELFEPAGMTRTGFGDAEELEDRALGYEARGDELVPAHAIDMSIPHAAGGVRSTAADLVRWHRALAGDAILGPPEKSRLTTPEKDGYAYGWIVGDHAGHEVVQHGGGIDGFVSYYARVPELDLAVIVWTNNASADLHAVGDAALDVALGGTATPLEKADTTELSPAQRAALAGDYELTDEGAAALAGAGIPPAFVDQLRTIELRDEGDRLTLRSQGQPALDLLARSPTELFTRVAGITITIEPGATPEAAPARLHIEQKGLTVTYARAR